MRRSTWLRWGVAVASALLTTGAASADGSDRLGLWRSRPSAGPEVMVSGGVFNLSKDPRLVEGGVEVRWPLRAFGLQLAGGLSATEEQSVWGYAALLRPVHFAGRWRVVPGLGVAAYEEGDGKDLGGVVEFRSSLELAVELGRAVWLGGLFYHLSNAGLYDLNPGSNSLLLFVALPVGG